VRNVTSRLSLTTCGLLGATILTMEAMDGATLAVEAFLALVAERVRAYGLQEGLPGLEPVKGGFWLYDRSYACLLEAPGRSGFLLVLDRIDGRGRSKIVLSCEATEVEADEAARKIVAHFL
jgi:hypothetical protein